MERHSIGIFFILRLMFVLGSYVALSILQSSDEVHGNAFLDFSRGKNMDKLVYGVGLFYYKESIEGCNVSISQFHQKFKLISSERSTTTFIFQYCLFNFRPGQCPNLEMSERKEEKLKKVSNATTNSEVRLQEFEPETTNSLIIWQKLKLGGSMITFVFQVHEKCNMMLCYSNRSLDGLMRTHPIFHSWDTQNFYSSSYNDGIILQNFGTFLNHGLRNRVGTRNTSGALEIRSMPDLPEMDIVNCLDEAFADKYFRYEFCQNNLYDELLYEIQKYSLDTSVYDGPPMISLDLSPHQPNSQLKGTLPEDLYHLINQRPSNAYDEPQWTSAEETYAYISGRRRGGTGGIVVHLFVYAASVVLIISIGVYSRVRPKTNKRENPSSSISAQENLPSPDSIERNGQDHSSSEAAEDIIGRLGCFEFDFSIINVATNNFSERNKIGCGGVICRGILPDGQQIAVKRFYQNRSQLHRDYFKNEVLFGSKFLHRNIVRLLGFCSEEDKRFLVYEFFPMSLDRVLFDAPKVEHAYVNCWDIRYKIIKGIASGLLYLHEDSGLTVAHGDIRAGKILLAENLNPKILGSGSAKLFRVDQSDRVSTDVVETLEYLGPEYLQSGVITVMSDVYSFGVLLLEIVSGQRSECFRRERAESFVSYALRRWSEGTASNLVDPKIRDSAGFASEIMRCINIALLCIQEEADSRPAMSSVVLMLNCDTLPLPGLSESEDHVELQDQSSNDSFVSASEMSLSQISETSVQEETESDNVKSGFARLRGRVVASFREIRSSLQRNLFGKRQRAVLDCRPCQEESNVLV